MELALAPFPEEECTEAAARHWLEAEMGARVMSVPDAPGHDYPPHSHSCDEVIVGVDGHIDFWARGQHFPLEAGMVLYLPVGTEHSARVAPSGCLYLVGQVR